MKTLYFIPSWFMLVCFIALMGCESKDSPAVASCKRACLSSATLKSLNSKVMYKPIKLCQKRCAATQGTCMDPPQSTQHRACIYYGMNAGSMTPRKPGSLSPFGK